MLHTLKPLIYKAFGLNVISDILFSELPHVDIREALIDVSIKLEKELLYINELSLSNKKMLVKENLVIFEVKDIAVFSIEDGSKITVSPLKEYEEDIVRIYLLGTCMGALLMQRKILPFHGSVVAVNGKAYAFIGDSGAGKSTLATAFLNQGYQLISDDVIPVTLSENFSPIVTPSYPQQKLWIDSLNMLGFDPSSYRSIYGRENKYCVPVPSRYSSEPIPLGGIFELSKTEDEFLSIKRMKGLSSFKTLFNHTYRNFFISEMGLTNWHFNTSSQIVRKIEIFSIRRPVSKNTADILVSSILNIIGEEKSK